MTGFSQSPRLLKGGVVQLDPDTGQVLRVISLQYNPDALSRSLQPQAFSEGGDRSEPLRLKGPAIETIKLDAEIDAADQLEFPDQNANTTQYGIQPQLAVLETLVHPSTAQLQNQDELASSGRLEIAPIEAPLTLFIWGRSRILPVQVTEFSINEEAFDPALNPIRAKVGLGLRVLSVADLGFEHRGGGLFMTALGAKEQLASKALGSLAAFGLSGIP